MARRIHVIYVPGLGDKKRWLLWLQKQALRTWRLHGVVAEVLPMYWAEDVPLKPRFNKLLQRIDQLHEQGVTVSLVGTSAGASAVVSAFALRPKSVHGVATICGKLQGDIPDIIKELNPCFAESLEQLVKLVDKIPHVSKSRIVTLHAMRDSIVPPSEAVISGAVSQEVRLFGHNTTCAYILLLGSRRITNFLWKQTVIQ